MSSDPRVVLVDGPPGAGKTTVAAELKQRFAGEGLAAILEHDDFALMAGAPAVGDASARVWTAALLAVVGAARGYIHEGLSVCLVVNYGRDRKAVLMRMLGDIPVRHVLLLPPWDVTRARASDRMAAPARPVLPYIGESAHRQFYDDLCTMAADGEFDEVIDTSRSTTEEAAAVVAGHLLPA